MSRARLAAALLAALLLQPASVRATPFADVPVDNWAYGDIQSLAADGLVEGYPDGSFKGDRPLTRYEMAAIVARVIAKLEAEGVQTASKADLDKLQKLMNALKDELDALGVRVTTLEDEVASLDARTKVAQALAVHGSLAGTGLSTQRLVNPTGVGGAGIDNFVNAYVASPASNNPIGQQNGPQTLFETDNTITVSYTIDPNLTVSVPIRVMNYNVDGEFSTDGSLTVQPDLVVQIPHAGAITGLLLRAGQLNDLHSSLTGLTYEAPDPTHENATGFATQPFPTGFELAGTIAGQTDVQLMVAGGDPTLINTQPYVASPSGTFTNNGYFTYVQAPQTGYAQFGPSGSPAGALATDTFNAGAAVLTSVYLRRKAVAGTVYISGLTTSAGHASFDNTGAVIGPPVPGIGGAPPFTYLDATNQIVFTAPLPPGSVVSITYDSLGYANQQYQRYEAGLRVEQHFLGLPGAELGITAHRLWDETGPVTTSDYSSEYNGLTPGLPGDAEGPVTDTVFGIDAQLPLAFLRGRTTKAPALFGEYATSWFTPDVGVTAPVNDAAGIVGLHLTLGVFKATVQYQSVGAAYLSGAPYQYFGNAPATWADYQGASFPQFFGFANDLAVNQLFDASVNRTAPGTSNTAGNPALTFIYPVFNPFVASGPYFNSTYAPNEAGLSLDVSGPLTIGGLAIGTHVTAEHLTQISANANSTSTYGPQYATLVRATFDQVSAAGSFNLPLLGRRATLDVSGTFGHLERNDRTAQAYIPTDPATGAYDATALADAAAAGGSGVAYYPNYVNMYNAVLAAGLAWPVARDVQLSARVSDQHYYGAYGTTLAQNIGGAKDQLDLDLIYTLPNTADSLGLGYRLSNYSDVVLPSYNFLQSQENVNFAIHF